MLIKAGVDISRLERMTRRSLPFVEKALIEQHEELTITSTYEGRHGAGSLHYANQAYDVRLPAANVDLVIRQIRAALGRGFDVVLRPDHIHIEYDPK